MILQDVSYELKAFGWQEIEKLYKINMQEDFPLKEIKPLSLLKKLYEDGINKVFGFYEGKNLKAYAVLEKPKNVNIWLLDYLAVCKEQRGAGLGGLFLRRLKNVLCEADAVMAEIERIDRAVDDEQRLIRQRRKQFYLKNGFYETSICTEADGGVDYEILCLPVKQQMQYIAAEEAMKQIYNTFFKEGEYKIYASDQRIC